MANAGPRNFLGNESLASFVYRINKAASLRAATLSPTNQPRTETPFYLFVTNLFWYSFVF